MVRRLALALVPIALVAGCTRVPEFHPTPAVATEAPHLGIASSDDPPGGEVFIALPYPQFIFGPHLDEAAITSASEKAATSLDHISRLTVEALPSTPATVAISLKEISKMDQHWGSVMIPAERRLFQTFAGDTSLGSWLILITDVEVTDGPDPIPQTAYRWSRPEVESFAACGIPPTAVDECTDRFFVSALVQVLNPQGIQPQQ